MGYTAEEQSLIDWVDCVDSAYEREMERERRDWSEWCEQIESGLEP